MLTSKNLIKHEHIGLKVSIADSDNSSIIGLKGIVVNETRNTLVIETDKGEKTLLKEQCVFVFELPEGKVRIDGKLLASRPEDRIRKKFRSY